MSSDAALAFFFFLLKSTRAAPTAIARNATPPTPIPAFLPVLRPERGVFDPGLVLAVGSAAGLAFELAAEEVSAEVSAEVAVGLGGDALSVA